MDDKCGTSMAAPHVTGLIATLMDHYSWLRSDPSLVKAYLMARAIPHNNSASSAERNQYGAGRIDSYVAHYDYPASDGWVGGTFHGSVSSLDWIYEDITVPSGTTRLIIVLAWDEPPVGAGSSRSVFYDLDLWADLEPYDSAPNTGTYASTSAVDI